MHSRKRCLQEPWLVAATTKYCSRIVLLDDTIYKTIFDSDSSGHYHTTKSPISLLKDRVVILTFTLGLIPGKFLRIWLIQFFCFCMHHWERTVKKIKQVCFWSHAFCASANAQDLIIKLHVILLTNILILICNKSSTGRDLDGNIDFIFVVIYDFVNQKVTTLNWWMRLDDFNAILTISPTSLQPVLFMKENMTAANPS